MTVRYADRISTSLRRSHVIMGIIQMTLACLVIALTMIGLYAKQGFTSVGTGFWVGPLVLVAGITGYLTGTRHSYVILFTVACLVFAILSCVMAMGCLVAEAIIAGVNLRLSSQGRFVFADDDDVTNGTTTIAAVRGGVAAFTTVYITGVACAVLFALEFVLAIVQAVLAGRASCCCVAS